MTASNSRPLLTTLGLIAVASCGPTSTAVNRQDAPSPATNAAEGQATELPGAGERVALVINQRVDHPLPLALQMGTLSVEGGCLVFRSGQGRLTPVWPMGTRWSGGAGEGAIRLPNGAEFRLGAAVNLPGGPFGRPGATDLQPSPPVGSNCPQDLYAVNGT